MKTEDYLNGLIVFEPKVFIDSRGFFMESYVRDELKEKGIPDFVQENHSQSIKNVFRGLHFQWSPPQGKLIRVIRGSAIFFELDIRKCSSTFGYHIRIELNDENKKILWVPPGFANGFLSITDKTDVIYKCTANWNGKAEGTIIWNDSTLGIDLGIDNPVVSEKDKKGMTLNDWVSREESDIFKL